MASMTFDTHRFVISLQKSGFSTEQAEGINNALNEALQTADVATKGDIREMEARIEAKMEAATASIIKWLAGLMIAQGAAIAALVKLL